MKNIKNTASKAALWIISCGMLGLISCRDSNPTAIDQLSEVADFPAFARINDGSDVAGSIDLNGTWEFKATDEREWMNAQVPGTVHEDLIRAGRLDDPYYRDNEFDAQWVEKKEWEYRRSFKTDEAFLQKDKVILECRGLDAIAEVYLNEVLLANTQNMFIEYEFDVKNQLRAGENTLRVVFRSVLEWNKAQADADPRVTWRSGEAVTNDATKGLLYYSRKEASDFGWDWGIRLLSCGIWKPVRLVAYNTGRIAQLGVRQDLANPDEARLMINAEVDTFQTGNFAIDIEVALKDSIVARGKAELQGNKGNCAIAIPEPQLWWPAGLGKQPLYTVKAILKNNEKPVHSRQIRIGLRTIEIDREKDERGETFGIKVNGNLIFCKGANWIPADAMTGRLMESKYRNLLQSCIDANMNMIRLWGGGLYEPDVFYEFCDENGLLIWHDFMFASGPYLATEPYLGNVKAEIKNVVLRRRHYPSIALWCGNNESESNMAGGQNWIKLNPAVNWEEYDKIFYEAIPETAALYDPDRLYWPSSPHNPLDREKKNPDYNTASGTAHTYEVWGGQNSFEAYSQMGKYRFVAEFGFHSLPHIQTIKTFTAPGDRSFPSMILDHHNLVGKKPRQNQGNVRIIQYTAEMFRMPVNFESWVSVTQILQGEGMKMGCEAMRRNYPESTGALYWQLNDNWPVISWSSIDYFGRWKALQYMAARFFNPVLVSGVEENGKVQVYGTNDFRENLLCTLEWALCRFDGEKIKEGQQQVELPANRSARLATLDFSESIAENPEKSTYRKDSYRNRSSAFLSFRLLQGDSILSSNIVAFVPQKHWNLQNPAIEFVLSKENGKTCVELESDKFAAYVELCVRDSYARFSDNFFHLLPGEAKKVYVVSSEADDKEFKEGFFVRSLIDTYAE